MGNENEFISCSASFHIGLQSYLRFGGTGVGTRRAPEEGPVIPNLRIWLEPTILRIRD